MYGCHVLPVPLPAAMADNLSDHRVPAVSMEPISQAHAIQRALYQLDLTLEMIRYPRFYLYKVRTQVCPEF